MDDKDSIVERLDGIEYNIQLLSLQIARLTLELQQNAYPKGAITGDPNDIEEDVVVDEIQQIADEVNAELEARNELKTLERWG